MGREDIEDILLSDEITEDTRFEISDDSTADWALKKIADMRKERDRIVSIADEQIAELKTMKEKEEEKEKRQEGFLMGCLFEYFGKVPHKETKTQENYALLHGSLVMKKESKKMVADDDQLVAYFKNNNLTEYVKVKETPAWGEFKKTLAIEGDEVYVKDTGELLNGIVNIEVTPIAFDIKEK